MLQGDREDAILAAKEELKAKVLAILDKYSSTDPGTGITWVRPDAYQEAIKEIKEIEEL